jgi:V/A-type H+-transporting ATPase subunit B
MRLSEHIYRTISTVAGPLLFIDGVSNARIGEVVKVLAPDGRKMDAEVLEIDGSTAMVEVYGETRGLDVEQTAVVFTDAVKKVPLSSDIVGRVFNGSFEPKDGLPLFIPEKWMPVTGSPMNPAARARPEDFIETGFSTIDGLNTLVRGQKLPVFSCAGLPSKEVVASILRNARLAQAFPSPRPHSPSGRG